MKDDQIKRGTRVWAVVGYRALQGTVVGRDRGGWWKFVADRGDRELMLASWMYRGKADAVRAAVQMCESILAHRNDHLCKVRRALRCERARLKRLEKAAA